MSDHRIGNPIARSFEIGRFFEALTAEVIGGARLDDEFQIDIEHPGWDSMIEVKAGGTDSGPAVYTEQLENHLQERGFPYAHCCYALWLYRNTRQHRISCLTDTVGRLDDELARRTEALYVLDVRILEALYIKRGTFTQRRFNWDASRLHTKSTVLRTIALAPHKFLRELGLRPRTFYIQQGTAQLAFRGRFVQFDYTAILPRTAARFVWPVHIRPNQQVAATERATE